MAEESARVAIVYIRGEVRGTVFCRRCLCAFVPAKPTKTDHWGARLHERQNPAQHPGKEAS